MNVYLKIRGT